MPTTHPTSLTLLLAVAICGCPKSQTGAAPPPAKTATADVSDSGAPTAPPTARASATSAPSAAPASSVPDIRARCAAEIRRQIDCKDQFIPMIVDTRIKLDLPLGIAAKGKDKAGRDALVVEAHAEFLSDYVPDKIEAICEKRQAQVAGMPPAVLQQLQSVDVQCHTETDCATFTQCMAPMLERMLGMGASSGVR